MPHSSHCYRAVLIGIAIVYFCSSAAAQTRSWVGIGALSSWHDPINWIPSGVPLSGDSVFVGDLPGTENEVVIFNFADSTVANFTMEESTTMFHDQDKLTVTGTMRLTDSSEYSLAYGGSPGSLLAGNLRLEDSSEFRMNTLSDVEVEQVLTIGPNATLYQQGGDILLSNTGGSNGAVLINDGIIFGSGTGPFTVQAAGAGKIDLDGSSGMGQIDLTFSSFSVAHTMRVLSPLSDSFGGVISIGHGSTLEITNPWTADSLAEINLSLGRIAGGPFTSQADIFVTGPSTGYSRISSNAVITGGTIDVATDGRLRFESTASLSGEATIDSDGEVRFDGSTTFNGADMSGSGSLILGGPLTVQGAVNLAGTTLDWDGTGSPAGKSTTINSGASLNLDFDVIDTSDDVYDGLLTMNGGTLNVNNLADEWTHAGTAVITGNNTIAGDRLVVNGDFNVASGAQTIQAQVDFGGAADVDIFGAGTSVTTQASARFQPGTEVTVGAGSTLNLNGTVTWDGPALVDGAGTIVQNGSSVVTDFTTIDVANFDWDGAGESSTTNVADSSWLTINSTQIDSNNHFNGNLLITGTNAAVVVNTTAPWHMDGYLQLDRNGGLAGTAPVSISGQVDVNGTSTSIASDSSFVSGSHVELADDSWFGLYGSVNNIDGADFQGPGTLVLWGATTINSDSTIDVETIEVPNAPLTMTGGHVTTANFTKDAATAFNLQGGNFTISGGDAAFNSTFIFGGSGDPLVRVEDGADAVVTFAWRMSPNSGDSATTVVTGTGGGQRSTLRGTAGGAGADLVVGLNGSGSLVVSQGALASFRDDFIIAQNVGSVGQATVIGVNDGFRSTVDVTGSAGNSSVQIGGGDGGGAAAGILRIQNGALVQTSGDVVMARYVGEDSIAYLEIGGMAGGFPAELNVADDIFVGGTATTAGGNATVTLDDGGIIRGDEMFVWGDSTVDMHGGELFLHTLDIDNGGDFNLLGGTIHVDLIEGQLTNVGGTISPGGSPGITTITEDYKHEPDASLLIELGGLIPADEHDVFEVNNDMILNGGDLEVVFDGGFIPQGGDRFDILNFSSVSGTFGHVRLPALHATLAWDTSQLYATGELSVVSAGFSADFDDDGDVDKDDLGIWQKFYGQTDDADADADGDSDGRDFLAWQRQYTGPGKIVANMSVPEPASGWLATLAIFAALRLRLHRKSHGI